MLYYGYMFIYLGFLGAILGIWISVRLLSKKESNKKLACPRNGHCDKVIHSTYSKTFGIQNEILGIVYFSAMAILFSMDIINVAQAILLPVMMLISTGGMLFSLYLIYIQWAVLRTWCTRCLGVAFANFLVWATVIGLFLIQYALYG